MSSRFYYHTMLYRVESLVRLQKKMTYFAGEWGFVTYQIYLSVGKYEIQPRCKKENLSSYLPSLIS